MRLIKQIILSLAVIAVTGFLWLNYVPSAAGFLDRIGLTDLLGIEVTEVGDAGGSRGFGPRGPAQVVVSPVIEATVNDRIESIGDGRALRSATLRTEVSGEVVEVALQNGGYVEEGAVILRLDDEAERIAVERARLMVEDARDGASRFSRLQDGGSVTEVRVREAELTLRTAELQLSEAEFELARRTIRAPFAGWIGLLDVAIGDRLSPQDAITSLTDRSDILIDFRVPERVVGLVAPGMPIEARPLGPEDAEPLKGEIHAVDNIVDRSSRTLRVQGKLANDDDDLRAGMAFAVSMRFPGETLSAVDPLAVQWASEGSYVWAVRDDTAQRVAVTIRQRDADRVLVEGDLAPGDSVVVEGVQSLRPGAEVAVASQTEARATMPGGAAAGVAR